MVREVATGLDGYVLLMWKATHINVKELYQFDGKIENPSKIFWDWAKNNELNELALVDMKTKDEVIVVNLMDGSFVVGGQLIKFENDGAPYRAVHYAVTKRKSFSSDEFARVLHTGLNTSSGGVIRYCIGWQYTNKHGQNKKAILNLDARNGDWYIDTEK
jgi:hypothetical protein